MRRWLSFLAGEAWYHIDAAVTGFFTGVWWAIAWIVFRVWCLWDVVVVMPLRDARRRRGEPTSPGDPE